MNCKPGDLAVMVHSQAGNEGRIVRCLKLYMQHAKLGLDGVLRQSPCWDIGEKIPTAQGGKSAYVPDAWLRPIRGDGITETEVTALYTPTEIKRAKESVETTLAEQVKPGRGD